MIGCVPTLSFNHIIISSYQTIEFYYAELIEPMWPDGPQRIEVGECDCSIAWLYKDAHKYGLTQYQDLVGDSGNNVLCIDMALHIVTLIG